MKKTTILAVSLVLAVAISAVWFVREWSGDEQAARPVADAAEPSLPGSDPSISDDSVAESATEETAASSPPVRPDAEALRLFSSPDRFDSAEYMNARDRASQYLSNFRAPSVSRSQLLKANQAGIDELVRQIESNPNGFSTSFDITPFGDMPCAISSIEFSYPKASPSEPAPSSYQAETKCDNSGASVTVAVNKGRGLVSFGIRSGLYGGFAIVTLDDSGYSVAYQMDPNAYRGGVD